MTPPESKLASIPFYLTGDRMGLAGISPLSLLLIFFIAVVLFGSDKLQQMGRDLGEAVKQFRKAVSDETPHQDKDGSGQ